MTDQASKVLGRMRGDDTFKDGEGFVSDAEVVNRHKQEANVCLLNLSISYDWKIFMILC